MKKYIKMKPVGGILITLLTALPLYAQDNNEIVYFIRQTEKLKLTIWWRVQRKCSESWK